MLETFDKIEEFNKKAGLLGKDFNDSKEAEYIIEEALEQFDTSYLAKKLLIDEDSHAKFVARAIVTGMCKLPDETIADVDRFDKILDVMFFSWGAALKLGVTSEQILEGLGVVADANLTKVLDPVLDEHGKVIKPKSFIPPEKLLQVILDSRSSKIDRDALEQDLVEWSVDFADTGDLVRNYRDSQQEFISAMSEKEIVDFANTYIVDFTITDYEIV